MPFGAWKNFAACKRDVEAKQGYTDEQSDKVCGKLKDKLEKSDRNVASAQSFRIAKIKYPPKDRNTGQSGNLHTMQGRTKQTGKFDPQYVRQRPLFGKGEVIDNFLVKAAAHKGYKVGADLVRETRQISRRLNDGTEIGEGVRQKQRADIEAGMKHLNKGKDDLPRAKKDKDEWKKKDAVPIPAYERPDKCSDTKVTPPEKKIKKEDEIEKDRLGGNFTDSHGNTMYSRGKPTGSVSYDDKGTGTVVHRKTGNWLTTDSPNQTGDVVSRSKQKDTTTRAGRRFMRKGEVIDNFLVKAHSSAGRSITGKDANWRERNTKYWRDRKKEGDPAFGDHPRSKAISKNECPCAGAKVEMEHKDTLLSLGIPEDKIPEAAKKIAEDHIKEDPEYYKKLKQMEGVKKAEVEPDPEETQIRQLRLKSRLSPSIKDLKEVSEVKVKEVKKDDIKMEWVLDLDALMKSDREFSGTFHKPVIDKENDIIPASAMDKAMDDFMILPTLQEVHTERPVGIITKAWKNGDDEYYLEGKIKPGDDCDDVWQKIKKGEYDGLSIGGRRVNYSKECAIPSLIRDTPCVTHRLKLYNVSVCSSPVNPEASIDEFNKVAKSETGVGEEVFDLTETLKKAMTAGASTSEGSKLNHGIFDGRKKDVTEKEDFEKAYSKTAQELQKPLHANDRFIDRDIKRLDRKLGRPVDKDPFGKEGVDKGAWTAKRGTAAGLQQTSMRAAEVRPRTAQKPNNADRIHRHNKSKVKPPWTAKFTKSDITQLIDSINEISKGFVEGSPYKSAHAHGREAKTFRDFNRERDRTKEKGDAAEGLKNLTKGTFQENRAGQGHMRSRSPLSHPDESLGYKRPGEKTFEHRKPSRSNPNLHTSTQMERAQAGQADLRVKDKGREGWARGRTVNPHHENRYKTIGKSDIYQLIDSINEISKGWSDRVQFKGTDKSRHEHAKESLKRGTRSAAMWAASTARGREREKEAERIYGEDNKKRAAEGLKNMTKSDDDEQKPIREGERVKRKEKSQGEDYHDGKLEKGDNMDEEIVDDVEYVEKSDDELITKSDIDALTEAIVGLQKSFESYFATLTTPQPQHIEGKKHEVEDTMKKAEDVPVNNMEVIQKAYDDKIKALEEKIAKMENTTIRKGGEAVIIPEQLQKDDTILTNMNILNGIGRMTK